MSKSKVLQRKVIKINAKRILESLSSLNISLKEAKLNGEVVSLGESDAIRMIDIIKGRMTGIELAEKYKKTKEKADIFLKEYVIVTFDDKKTFYHMAKNGFVLNGKKFKRLVGTNGGVKNNSIVFVSMDVYDELNKMILNEANIPEMIPAKLESYRSLVCSATTPVTYPNKMIVVDDYITTFNSDVTFVDSAIDGIPQISEIDNHELKLDASDGYGLISPSLSREWRVILDGKDDTGSGFGIRNSYLKGMCFTFPIDEFAESNGIKTIKDVWGQEHSIEGVDLIVPKSVFKLWSAYDSASQYLDSCMRNNHNFSCTKIITEKIDNQRTTNYQFLQTLKMADEEIDIMIKPTVDEYRGVLGEDYLKSLLFLKGKNMTERNVSLDSADFSTALQIEKELIKDPFVRGKIRQHLEKRINDAKKGKIKVDGNFQIISGDPIGFMQHALGIENPEGLLKANEFYSSYWNSKGVSKVVGMRAPMTVHANIRKMNLVSSDDMEHWYRYMKNIFIFNDWDATCFTLNGSDKDGDAVFTTSSREMWNGTHDMRPVVCSQSSAKKVKVTERLLEKSNADGFNGSIGSITNSGSNMIDLLPSFDENSEEYKVLNQRIIYTMKAQQDEIDAIKGAKSYGMPKEWFDFKCNIPKEDDCDDVVKRKQFNLRILANKQPYFFIYNYQETKRKFAKYTNLSNIKSKILFRKSVNDIYDTANKTSEQVEFLKMYEKHIPVNMSHSLMNTIAKKVEHEFDKDIKECFKEVEFDSDILKTDKPYTKKHKRLISEKHKEYLSSIKKIMLTSKSDDNYDMEEAMKEVGDTFKLECLSICNNDSELMTNVIVDICYKNNVGKQFVWDTCCDQIIKNLLFKNNNKIIYLEKSDKGNVFFDGDWFECKTKVILEDVNEDNK